MVTKRDKLERQIMKIRYLALALSFIGGIGILITLNMSTDWNYLLIHPITCNLVFMSVMILFVEIAWIKPMIGGLLFVSVSVSIIILMFLGVIVSILFSGNPSSSDYFTLVFLNPVSLFLYVEIIAGILFFVSSIIHKYSDKAKYQVSEGE